MSAPLVQYGCVMICPHGGLVQQIPSQKSVLAGGQPVLLPADAAVISGCSLAAATPPMPCLTVQWSGVATKNKINDEPPLLASSVGQCLNQAGITQGTVMLTGVQTKAVGQ